MDISGYNMIFMASEAVVYFLLTLLVETLVDIPSFVALFKVSLVCLSCCRSHFVAA